MKNFAMQKLAMRKQRQKQIDNGHSLADTWLKARRKWLSEFFYKGADSQAPDKFAEVDENAIAAE